MSGVKRQRLDGMGGPGMGGPAWAGVGPGDGYGFDGGMMMMGPGYPQGMGMVPGAFPGAFAGAPMGGMGAPYGEAFDVFPCVKLRGLPFHVGEHDIRGFLGLETVDILMVQRGGRFSGEAYVLLGSPMQLELAVQKNRQHMGKRYVEVFPCRKLDYYRAVNLLMGDEAQVAALQSGPGAGSAAGSGGGGGGASPAQMMGARGGGGGGMMGGGGGGGMMGGGYMPGGPMAPQMGGMMPYGAGMMHGGGVGGGGGGGGMMMPQGPPPGRGPRNGGPPSAAPIGPSQGPGGGGGGGGAGSGVGGGYEQAAAPAAAPTGSNIVNNVLKLRGLPFSASAAEVAAWFASGGLPIAQLSADNVRLITNREGRATGQAFVEFPTQAEAEAGLAMDRQMMGSRYVEIFTVTRDEYLRVTNGPAY